MINSLFTLLQLYVRQELHADCDNLRDCCSNLYNRSNENSKKRKIGKRYRAISNTLNKGAGEGRAYSCTQVCQKLIYASYDGSFLNVSYAYASQFYDAFFFYHKA